MVIQKLINADTNLFWILVIFLSKSTYLDRHKMDIFKNHIPNSSIFKNSLGHRGMSHYIYHSIYIYFPSQVSCLRKPNGFLIRKLFRHEMYYYICMYVLVHKIQLAYINHTITTPLATLFIYFLAQLFS